MPSSVPSRHVASRRALLLIGACLSLSGIAAAENGIIERILAVVDGRPVLFSDVEVVALVRGVDRKAALEATIDEQLMFREAQRLPQTAVSPDEEERAYASLVTTVGGAVSVSSADLRRLARRQTTILKYVLFRFRPQVRVADEDVRHAYESTYRDQTDPPLFEAVEEALREHLAGKELDDKIEAWVKDLRSSAEIRYNSPGVR